MTNPNDPGILSGIDYDSQLTQKWSKAILDGGYTVVPNLLIKNMSVLGIESYHLSVLLAIEMHRWRPDSAWPSQQALADITGYSLRRINEITSELNDMSLIKKIYRHGRPCLYDFEPLVHELESLLGISQKPQLIVKV